VRRWSDDTRLNGEPFTEALLNIGDRLTVGPIEFEVVDGINSSAPSDFERGAALPPAAVPGPVTEPSTSPNRQGVDSSRDANRAAAGHGRARARRLLTRLREVCQENELNGLRLARQEEELQKLREAISAEEQRRENERPAQIAEQERASLEEQRNELEEARRQLEEDRTVLQEERAAFAQAWSAFEQERASLESQRLLLQQELRTFEEHKHALTLERIDWQTDTSRAEADLANRRDELDRRAAALEKQRLDHESARRRLEDAELDLTRRQEVLQRSENDLLEKMQQVERQRAALESERTTLLQDRAQVDAQRQTLATEQAAVVAERQTLATDQAALVAERQTLAIAQAALATERQDLETLRRQEQNEGDELARQLAEQARQLTEATERLNRVTQELQQQQALVETARQELDDERAQWDADRERLMREHEQQLVAMRLELEHKRVAEPIPEPEPELPAQSEEEVFSRLRSMSVLKPEFAKELEVGATDAAEATVEINNAHVAEAAQPASIDEGDQAGEPSGARDAGYGGELRPTGRHEEDDESIDNYMAQLLKRVRGVGSAHESPASQARETVQSRVQQETESASPPPSSEQTPVVQEVPARLARRAPAPELSSDLAAMRELANLSARAAIDKHAYRNWGRAAFGKLTIALLAAGTGAGAVHFAPAPDSMLMYAGLSSFVVAVFWLLQAGILINHVIQVSRRNGQLMDTSGDEETDQVSPDSTDEFAEEDEEEYAPAELIQAHDTYDIAQDEVVVDEPDATIAIEQGGGESAEAATDVSDDDPTGDEQ
jgi:hypothetical protein